MKHMNSRWLFYVGVASTMHKYKYMGHKPEFEM